MALQDLGEELYPMVEELYPELARRLTGMLLQLGEIECRTCINDQNTLADRLGEALEILHSDPSDQRVGRTEASDPGEKRIDPDDGNAKTLQQLRAQHKGQYTALEIDEYWQTCKPDRSDGVDAESKTTFKSGGTSKSEPAPANASAAPAPKSGLAKEEFASEPVKGLSAWLNDLDLGSYFKVAAEWVEEQGAVTLEELVENLEDFADDLRFTGPERKRLEDGAEDAIAAARAEPASVVNEASTCMQNREEPSDVFEDHGEDDLSEGRSRQLDVERDFSQVKTFAKEPSPARRWPKTAPSQDASKPKLASRPKQELAKQNGALETTDIYDTKVSDVGVKEPAPSAGKGKGKQSAAAQEQRVDPSNGMARTLSELHELYAGEYSPQEIEDYWRDCRPIGISESAPNSFGPTSGARSGFSNVATAPSPVAGGGQEPKAKAGGYWGSGSKRRF